MGAERTSLARRGQRCRTFPAWSSLKRHRIIVVGAGIGGLTAAALLARDHDVTVVERQATPGGKARSVDVGGVAVDGGPTVLTMRWVFDELFAACGGDLGAAIGLTPAHILARHAWDGARLDLFADEAASADAIAALAGSREAAGFRAFMVEAKAVLATLTAPFLRGGATSPLGLTWRLGPAGLGGLAGIHPFATLWARLARHFADPRLRQLFGRYATYSGSSPVEAPATLMLIAAVEAEGVWMAEGGISALARALAALGEGCGATFRYACEVASVDGGSVTLVSGERLAADAVVVNADPQALALGLLGNAARRAVPAMRPRDRSLSALVWTIDGAASGFPLVRHNVFFSGDSPAEFADLAAGRLPRDPHRLCLRAGPRRPRRDAAGGCRAIPAYCQRARAGRRCPGERDRPMHDGDFRAAGAQRAEPEPARLGADDAGGVRAPVSGQRGGALRAGDARDDGGVQAAGGRGRSSRGCISRAGRPIRARGYRWRRCRGCEPPKPCRRT